MTTIKSRTSGPTVEKLSQEVERLELRLEKQKLASAINLTCAHIELMKFAIELYRVTPDVLEFYIRGSCFHPRSALLPGLENELVHVQEKLLKLRETYSTLHSKSPDIRV